MNRHVKWGACVLVAGGFGLACSAAAHAEPCNLRLALTLTPDVPNPSDPGFLGAILSRATYQLSWIDGGDTEATVQLTGPGPASQCQDALEHLSRDAHVLDVKVIQPGETT